MKPKPKPQKQPLLDRFTFRATPEEVKVIQDAMKKFGINKAAIIFRMALKTFKEKHL